MFGWWGRTVVRGRWAVLFAGIVLVLVGGLWGTGVFGAVVGGGFDDPGSESAKAARRILAEVGRQDVDLLVLYSVDGAKVDGATIEDPAFRGAVTGTLDRLRQRPEIDRVISYYDTNSPAFVSTDRRATYAAIRLSEAASADQLHAVRDDLDAPGVRTQIGGQVAVFDDVSERVAADIGRAEAYSMPILLILLVLVFGSLVAATTPLLVGGLTILGAFAVTRLLTTFTDVSVFAVNIITLIGLGLAIDYALFMVSRFREELAGGRSTAEAVARTMATAGRTVAFSGLTVAVALSSLLLFPQVFLRSMGLGGMAAVAVAMLTSLTVLPALLAVLGPRIGALPVRLPFRRRAAVTTAGGSVAGGGDGAGGGVAGGRDGAGWARVAHAVMRRPIIVIAGTLVFLALLALPFTRAEFGGADERVLPAGSESRVVAERLAAEFPGGRANPVEVLVRGADAGTAGAFASRIGELPGVTRATIAATGDRAALITVDYRGAARGSEAREVVAAIRGLTPPAGTEVLVGGTTAVLVDLLHGLADRLPWMALFVALTTFVLLFLAFGSILLPIKAVLMNVVSIGASFGAVVWAFQDGHLAGLLGFTSTGDLEASQLVLMLAILFGLSTDYEVFLLSRVREEWDRTGAGTTGAAAAAANTAAVAAGLARTGRIITSAALLLVIVIGGFVTGGVSFIKMIGFGMIVALLVDATVVRALLVPATMRLLGRANWWAPRPLARLYRRYGVREDDPATEPEPAGPAPGREPVPAGA